MQEIIALLTVFSTELSMTTLRLHREMKQLTGIEKCQGRGPRPVRNHITCAVLVWVYLMQKAKEVRQGWIFQ